MRQRQTALFLPNDDSAELIRLEPVQLASGSVDAYSEGWLRDLIFANSEILPIGDVEPVLSDAAAVCTELPTPAGPADLFMMTPSGGLVLIECKLWRNPESRRKVVAQIIDYARCMTHWGYEDLDKAVQAARFPNGERPGRLVDLFAQDPGFDEAGFVDAVSRNLRRGRVLLMIVGDGIREEVEALAAYLQQHAGFHYTLALVEVALHDAPALRGRFVQPRLVTRTVTIERGIVIASDMRIEVRAPDRVPARTSTVQGGSISREEFLERLEARCPGITPHLLNFLDEATAIGVEPVFLRSLNLKWPDPTGTEHNLGYVKVNGGIWFDAVSWQLKTPEAERIAETYRQDVATAMGGEVRIYSSRGSRSVYVDEKPLAIEKALAHSQNWLSAMRQFIDAVADLQRRTLVD